MALSYFYINELQAVGNTITLEEDTSKHITQVLRMKVDDKIMLTDGKGRKAIAVITDDHRKKTAVEVLELITEEEKLPKVSIAISLVKNASRFEWFLEKATELGVDEIFPLVCERTEKEKFRIDRMQNIVVSALLQSQQSWMPVLHEPVGFENLVKEGKKEKNFIAHCLPDKKQQLSSLIHNSSFAIRNSALILIGPEGDFTQDEIDLALNNEFVPVALGNTRLRTETAGLVAAALLCAARDKE